MALLQAVSDQLLSMASSPIFNNLTQSLTLVVTAGGTTTLTSSSTNQQVFTGTMNQTVVMPVVSTLALGWSFQLVNRSSGSITVNSSGANLIQTMAANTTAVVTCIAITGTSAASWDARYAPSSGSIATTFNADSGSATVSGNAITISGSSTGLTTTGSGSTIGMTGTLAIANGGTGTGTAPSAGQILIGKSNNTYAVAAIGSGTNILVGNGDGAITIGITGQIAPSNGGTGLSSLGTGVATALGQNVTGSGGIVLATAPTFATKFIVTKVNGAESSNAVTASGGAGVITTSSLTTAGAGSYAITWTNSLITSTSGIALQIVGGTNTVQNITMTCVPGSGTATLTIYNNTAATQLNGTILISYLVY